MKITSSALICGTPALILLLVWALGGFTGAALHNALTSLFWASVANLIAWAVTARFCHDEAEFPPKAVLAVLLLWASWPAAVALNNTRDLSHFVHCTVDYSTSRHRTGKGRAEWEEVYIRATDEKQSTYEGQFRTYTDPKIGSGEKVLFEVHDGLFWSRVTSAKVGNRPGLEL